MAGDSGNIMGCRIQISNDELIEKLYERSSGCDGNLSFLIGVACGRIQWQQYRIADLEAALESSCLEMEDKG